MTDAQEKFMNTILQNVDKVNWDKAKGLLNEAFQKQAKGELNQAYLMTLAPKLMTMVKAENMGAIKDILKNFPK